MQINVEAAFCYGPADKQQQPSLFGQLLLEHSVSTPGGFSGPWLRTRTPSCTC